MKKINEVKILILATFMSIVLVGATIASRVEAAQGGTEAYEVLRFSNEIDAREVTTGVDWDYRVYGSRDVYCGEFTAEGEDGLVGENLTTPGHNYVDINNLHRPPVALCQLRLEGGTDNLYEE